MRHIIRLNDPTSHGGKVESVTAGQFTVQGIAVARVGDPCSCPIAGHSGCTIAEGDPNYTVDGIQVAFHGHHTTCGAELHSTIQHFTLT
jgi:uncharacterized Zn-binding protein involved in type VI secretion